MWAFKRKMIMLLVLILILVVFGLFFYVTFFKEDPTCFDGLKNGNEEGVDCGGTCSEICSFRATDVNIFWVKTFEVGGGVSNVAALIENPNFDYKISGKYVVKLFDKKGINISEFVRDVSLDPAEKRLVFLPSIKTGEREIATTFMDFVEFDSVIKSPFVDRTLYAKSREIEMDGNTTSLIVSVENKSLESAKNIEIVAVLSTTDGEVLDVGKTLLEYLPKRAVEDVFLTWQKVFEKEIIRIDIYVREVKE